MGRRLVEKVSLSVIQGSNHPQEKTPALEPTFKNSLDSLGAFRPQPKLVMGRGGKREIPRRIEEFHPRGSAGRREIHGLSGPRKNVLPRRGNRTKNPT